MPARGGADYDGPMPRLRYVLIAVIVLCALAAGVPVYLVRVENPAVERELRERPDGERARKVMLLTLPSGRTLPVNYLREGDTVYAAADGRWWRELRGAGAPVELFVRGEALGGHARAVEDDPELRSAVFDRLRPTAPKIFGTLIQIELTPRERSFALRPLELRRLARSRRTSAASSVTP